MTVNDFLEGFMAWLKIMLTLLAITCTALAILKWREKQ